jgi:hypothetical protein
MTDSPGATWRRPGVAGHDEENCLVLPEPGRDEVRLAQSETHIK